MAILLVFEFPMEGPWGAEMAKEFKGLAEDIGTEPGLIWKVWTEAPERKTGGGVYLFEDENSARAYTAKHSKRLNDFGISGIDVRQFSVNKPLSAITRGR